jgi:transcriptional regulatory protein LevR
MRFIKLGLISIVFLFLIITAISLLLPSTVNISRAIDITAPVDSVYANISNLSKWKYWFANYDASQAIVSGNSTGVGASIKIDKTTIAITEARPGKIQTLWTSGGKSLHGDFNIFKQNNGSHITVQWHFSQHVPWYPWEKFASIASDKIMSPSMEQSLDNLKKLVEQ